MRNIVKAQFYQLKKESLVYVMFFVVLILQMTTGFGEMSNKQNVSGSEYIVTMGSFAVSWSLFFVAVIVGQLMGKDFMDRTANYEVMTGHLRKDVFWGRVIPAMLIGTAGALLLILAPAAVMSLIYGWGTNFTVGQYLLRVFLMIFPLMRIVSELVFFTILIKNTYITIAFGYFLVMLGEMFPSNVVLGISNLNLLCEYPAWEIYSFGDYSYAMYDASLSAATVLRTLTASLAFGAAFLTVSYSYFKRDDLR